MFRCAPASYIKNICSSINATWWRDDGTSSLPPSPVRLSWQSRQAGNPATPAALARPPPSPSRSEGDGAAAEEDEDILVWDTERHQEPGNPGSRSNPIQGALSMPSLGGFVVSFHITYFWRHVCKMFSIYDSLSLILVIKY